MMSNWVNGDKSRKGLSTAKEKEPGGWNPEYPAGSNKTWPIDWRRPSGCRYVAAATGRRERGRDRERGREKKEVGALRGNETKRTRSNIRPSGLRKASGWPGVTPSIQCGDEKYDLGCFFFIISFFFFSPFLRMCGCQRGPLFRQFWLHWFAIFPFSPTGGLSTMPKAEDDASGFEYHRSWSGSSYVQVRRRNLITLY